MVSQIEWTLSVEGVLMRASRTSVQLPDLEEKVYRVGSREDQGGVDRQVPLVTAEEVIHEEWSWSWGRFWNVLNKLHSAPYMGTKH